MAGLHNSQFDLPVATTTRVSGGAGRWLGPGSHLKKQSGENKSYHHKHGLSSNDSHEVRILAKLPAGHGILDKSHADVLESCMILLLGGCDTRLLSAYAPQHLSAYFYHLSSAPILAVTPLNVCVDAFGFQVVLDNRAAASAPATGTAAAVAHARAPQKNPAMGIAQKQGWLAKALAELMEPDPSEAEPHETVRRPPLTIPLLPTFTESNPAGSHQHPISRADRSSKLKQQQRSPESLDILASQSRPNKLKMAFASYELIVHGIVAGFPAPPPPTAAEARRQYLVVPVTFGRNKSGLWEALNTCCFRLTSAGVELLVLNPTDTRVVTFRLSLAAVNELDLYPVGRNTKTWREFHDELMSVAAGDDEA
jgi:hypothetical protein